VTAGTTSSEALATGTPPVFVDDTGRRRRRFRKSGYAAIGLCGCYVALTIAGLTGHGPLAGIRLPFAGGKTPATSPARPHAETFSPRRGGRGSSSSGEPRGAGANDGGAAVGTVTANTAAQTSGAHTHAGVPVTTGIVSKPSPTDPGAVVGTPGSSAPGQTGTAPGNSADAPGQAGTTPGQSGTAPGNSASAPGHSDTAPGNSGTAPGQLGTAPGTSDAPLGS
jgi:hypothetical protein